MTKTPCVSARSRADGVTIVRSPITILLLALMASRTSSSQTNAAAVEATVRNAGDRATSTVVFAFGGLESSAFERPSRRLVGFARVELEAGASETVTIELDWAALDVRIDGKWLTEQATYTVEIGQHAHDPAAREHRLDRF